MRNQLPERLLSQESYKRAGLRLERLAYSNGRGR